METSNLRTLKIMPRNLNKIVRSWIWLHFPNVGDPITTSPAWQVQVPSATANSFCSQWALEQDLVSIQGPDFSGIGGVWKASLRGSEDFCNVGNGKKTSWVAGKMFLCWQRAFPAYFPTGSWNKKVFCNSASRFWAVTLILILKTSKKIRS